MKKLLYATIFLSICLIGKAQDNTAEIQLKGKSRYSKTLNLKENGLIIYTSSLRYYSQELELIWDVDLKNNEDAYLSPVFTATTDGEYVYQIEYSKKRTDIYITQIKKDGTVKNVVWHKANKKEPGQTQTLFCDKNNLYMLETENEFGHLKSPGENEKLTLVKYDHATLSRTKTALDLPSIAGTNFWSYVGNTDNEFYLLNKSINKKQDSVSVNLLTINSEGELLNNLPIKISITDKTLKQSRNSKILYNNYTFKNNDVYEVYHHPTANSDGYTRMYAGPGSYGNVVLDINEKAIYCYGFYGNKKKGKSGKKYDGYYMYKLDFSGKEIWKIEKEFSEDLLGNKTFYVHKAPPSRYTSFFINNNNLKLNIWFYDGGGLGKGIRKSKNIVVQSYEFSKDGEVINSYYNDVKSEYLSDNLEEKDMHVDENLSEYVHNFSPKDKIKTEQYILLNGAKDNTYHHYFSKNGYILTHLNDKTGLFKLLYYKK